LSTFRTSTPHSYISQSEERVKKHFPVHISHSTIMGSLHIIFHLQTVHISPSDDII